MNTKKSMMLVCCTTFILLAFMTAPSMAGGVRVIYPDGRPAADLSVSILVDSRLEFALSTDSNGYFLFPTNDFSAALITAKEPGGAEFIPITLPAGIIASGDTALVLQPLL
ncbi:hypothetical protein [Geobacter sp.]|uniref:hypothetical protein n=1 Tax=Geobacter sp. TaxID=46610 RepID=UPI0027B89B08|nr:hypothetical protein [Geobacter sp.]